MADGDNFAQPTEFEFDGRCAPFVEGADGIIDHRPDLGIDAFQQKLGTEADAHSVQLWQIGDVNRW